MTAAQVIAAADVLRDSALSAETRAAHASTPAAKAPAVEITAALALVTA